MKNAKLARNAPILLALALPGGWTPAVADDTGLHLSSGENRVSLVELFSSEGCSSCPPADEWLATLRKQPGLWRRFVPVEFHVDYWNRLGWTDRFSKSLFTSRQQDYASEWRSAGVYTPGFVLNGREWRQPGAAGLDAAADRPGVLTVDQAGPRAFRVRFAPAAAGGEWTVYGALLANGLASRVTSGENGGRTLKHEFVVIRLTSAKMDRTGATFTAPVELSMDRMTAAAGEAARSRSVAFWVSRTGEQKPVQAVGGDLAAGL